MVVLVAILMLWSAVIDAQTQPAGTNDLPRLGPPIECDGRAANSSYRVVT